MKKLNMRKVATVVIMMAALRSPSALASHNWSKVAVDPVYKPVPVDTYYQAARGDKDARRKINTIYQRWDKAFLGPRTRLPREVYNEFKKRLDEQPQKMQIISICKGCTDRDGLKWDRFSEVVFSHAPVKVRHDIRVTFKAPAPALATTIEYKDQVYHLATSVLCSNLVWFFGEPKVAPKRLPVMGPSELGLPLRTPKQTSAQKPAPKASRFGLGAVVEYADYSVGTANFTAGGLSGKGSWIAGIQFFLEEPAGDSPVKPSAIFTLGATGLGNYAGETRTYARLDPQVRFGSHLWLNAGVAYTQGHGKSTLFVNPTLTVDVPYVTAEVAEFNSKPVGNTEDSLEPTSKVSRARIGAKIDEILGGLFDGTHGFFVTAGVGVRRETHDYPDGSRREVTTDNGVEGYLQVYKSLWEKHRFDRTRGVYRTDASSYFWFEGNYGMLQTVIFDPNDPDPTVGYLVTDVTGPAYNVVVRLGIKFNSFRGGRGLFSRD